MNVSMSQNETKFDIANSLYMILACTILYKLHRKLNRTLSFSANDNEENPMVLAD